MWKLIKKLFFPDGNNNSGSESGIPRADLDFLNVAKGVVTKWLASPEITLVWMKAGDFKTLVTNYETYLKAKINAASTRPEQSNILKNLNKEIDEKEEEVKGYCIGKWGPKNASSYYPQFGMVHDNHSWNLPRDNNDKSEALDVMISGIATHGFGANTYGTAYWTDIKARFDDALTSSTSIDSNVSANVGQKNIYKKQVNKVEASLRYVLRGNYPDEYQQVYRTWGWQKEDY